MRRFAAIIQLHHYQTTAAEMQQAVVNLCVKMYGDEANAYATILKGLCPTCEAGTYGFTR
jgi:hypothetical protein